MVMKTLMTLKTTILLVVVTIIVTIITILGVRLRNQSKRIDALKIEMTRQKLDYLLKLDSTSFALTQQMLNSLALRDSIAVAEINKLKVEQLKLSKKYEKINADYSSIIIDRPKFLTRNIAFMTKGQLCPFDSAVAVRLDVYRLETRKLNLGDTIINNLKQQLALNTKTIQELDTQIYLRNEMLLIKDKQIADKDRTIELLSTNFYIKPKDTWFKRK